MSMNTSTSSPSPAQVQQDYQTLKRSHFTSASHEVKEGHVEQHCVQNQSPTKKRRVLSEVQIDEFTTDPRLEVNMVLSSTDSLNDSPIPHLQDNSGDEVTALQHLQQVARNAMVSVNGASTPLNSEPTCEQVENIRPVVETNIHEDHTASEDEQMLVVARPSCPMTPEGILLPYTGPDKHKPLVNAHDFRSMTLLQFTGIVYSPARSRIKLLTLLRLPKLNCSCRTAGSESCPQLDNICCKSNV